MHLTKEPLNIHKQILTDIKGEADSNSVTVGTLRPHLQQWIDQTETQ